VLAICELAFEFYQSAFGLVIIGFNLFIYGRASMDKKTDHERQLAIQNSEGGYQWDERMPCIYLNAGKMVRWLSLLFSPWIVSGW